MSAGGNKSSGYSVTEAVASDYDEKTPLLSQSSKNPKDEPKDKTRWLYPKRISDGIVTIVGVLATPFIYTGQCIVACFYCDDDGNFSLLAPIYHIARPFRGRRKKVNAQAAYSSGSSNGSGKGMRHRRGSSISSQSQTKKTRRSSSIASTSTIAVSDSDSERPPTRDDDTDTPSRHTRSKSNASSSGGDDISPAKRSIRIKLHNEEALRQRKATKKAQASKSGSVSPEAAAMLKSPTGPVTVASKQLTKFPRAPEPPRPLVPRRQPSYSASNPTVLGPHQKTLIIDLDETLIHSMAKGGRFQTGHMVEVKLQASVGAGGQIIGPQVPILYYVHKRPYCDDFLKKVCGMTTATMFFY